MKDPMDADQLVTQHRGREKGEGRRPSGFRQIDAGERIDVVEILNSTVQCGRVDGVMVHSCGHGHRRRRRGRGR